MKILPIKMVGKRVPESPRKKKPKELTYFEGWVKTSEDWGGKELISCKKTYSSKAGEGTWKKKGQRLWSFIKKDWGSLWRGNKQKGGEKPNT